MKHGSLFSGIGGFDLASQWMGWENVFHCEWNDFGQKVLKYYWPNAVSYADITKTDFSIHRGEIDILTGGFPCQPYSAAGKRKGTADDRHLWPEMLRAIREIQPCYIVAENVRGLTNWNGGMVFDQVQAEMEAEGFEVLPFLLPACAVNAPHRRDRIWFVAYSSSKSRQQEVERGREERGQKRESLRSNNSPNGEPQSTSNPDIGSARPSGTGREIKGIGGKNHDEQEYGRGETELNTGPREFLRDATNANGGRLQKRTWDRIEKYIKETGTGLDDSTTGPCEDANASDTNSRRFAGEEYGQEEPGQFTETSLSNHWQDFPTQHPICSRNDGLPNKLDGVTFPKWRNESIKAYGNAIVPQVAYELFKAIESLSPTTNH